MPYWLSWSGQSRPTSRAASILWVLSGLVEPWGRRFSLCAALSGDRIACKQSPTISAFRWNGEAPVSESHNLRAFPGRSQRTQARPLPTQAHHGPGGTLVRRIRFAVLKGRRVDPFTAGVTIGQGLKEHQWLPAWLPPKPCARHERRVFNHPPKAEVGHESFGPKAVEGDVLKCIRLDIQPRLDLLGQGP